MRRFEKIPFIASFGSFLDETSILADLILPDHSFLESWAEAVPESGADDGRRQRRAARHVAAASDARDRRRAARRSDGACDAR